MMMNKAKKLVARLLAGSCLASVVALPAQVAALPVLTPEISSGPPAIPGRVAGLYENAREICGPITGGASNPEIAKRIYNFTTVMQRSQTGRDLIETAAAYDRKPAWMCFDNKIQGIHAIYYTGRGVLTVNAGKTDEAIIGDAAHELRHLFQEKSGSLRLIPVSKSDAEHIEFANEADFEAVASLVMWELKQAGISGPWNHHNSHNNYPESSICYAHISDAFARAINQGATPPQAAQAAFRTWYMDPDLLKIYRGRAHAENPTALKEQAATGCAVSAEDQKTETFTAPSPYVNGLLTRTLGDLPSYGINYIRQTGDLRSLLQRPQMKLAM